MVQFDSQHQGGLYLPIALALGKVIPFSAICEDLHTHIDIHTHTHMHAHTYIHTYTHTYTHIHTHAHTSLLYTSAAGDA